MTTVTHAPRQSVKDLLCNFHAKFNLNVQSIKPETIPLLDTIDVNSRIISEIAVILAKDDCDSKWRKDICNEILQEAFSDFSLAMYLCAISLIVPARMSTRRAFELGVATVYLWDLPHEFWGWRKHDQDLSFSAMLTHFNSEGYVEYIAHLENTQDANSARYVFNIKKFQEIYRELSNTIHGKICNLPPLSPERFSSDNKELEKHFKLIAEAQTAVIELLFARFQKLESQIGVAFPHIKRA